MNRVIVPMSVFATFCLLSAGAMAKQTFNQYEVVFKPQPGKGEVNVVTDGYNCKKGNGNQAEKKGCINFAEDYFGLITFRVGNSPRTCAISGTQWVISKIELSDKGYLLNDGTISNKGIFAGEDVAPWVKSAFPQITGAAGVLYEADPPKTGATHVTTLNLNNNAAAEGAKDIWYRVSIASCKDDSDVVLVTDPRFENEGTKN